MKNYKAAEDGILNLIAPTGGFTGGQPVLIGGLLVVPHHDAAEGDLASALYRGEFELSKTTADSATPLAPAYWNNTTEEITSAADDGGDPLVKHKPVGFFTQAALADNSLAQVMLTGQVG